MASTEDPSVSGGDEETAVDGLRETALPSGATGSSQVRRLSALQAGDVIGGTDGKRFEIIQRLGAGAMGVVHLARDSALDRTVALKFITHHSAATPNLEIAELFKLEARATARLGHENIVRIFDIGSESGVPFLVMEHLDGRSLESFRVKDEWDALRATKVMTDVVRGLAHAHKTGVVHRDLKPSNIFILKDGRAKILDFGLAGFGHMPGAEGSGASGVAGTPRYMAPEQWTRQPQDGRTDIWAAGVIFFWMLTGRPPFTGADSDALQAIVTSSEPAPSLRQFRPDLPEEAALVVDRALQKDITQRFGTAEDLLDALVSLEVALTRSVQADRASRLNRPRPERRQVTLLSCALADPIGAAERMEPEDFSELVGGLFEACATIVRQLEGTVVSQTGGRSVACFGYPEAHEDDAQRAVRAAFLLRDAVGKLGAPGGETPAVQIGVGTGLTMAGRLRTDDPDAPVVIQGEVPELTAWLERRAKPGEILVTERTQALLHGLFELEPLGLAPPEGARNPIGIYRVVRPRDAASRFAPAPSTGRTPFVGRDFEGARLRQLWNVARSGSGQVALLTGEAGIGKSRMVEMLKEQVTAESLRVLTAQCWSHFRHSALHPLVDCVWRLTDIRPDHAPAEKLRRLESALAGLSIPPRESVPVLATFLQIPLGEAYPAPSLSPDRFKNRLLETLASMLVAVASQRPTLFAIEDLHWSDASTYELLEVLIERVASAPIMVLATFRPEFQPIWAERAHVTRIPLPRLSATEAAALVELASPGRLPREVVAQLVGRSDGIPLFIEELTRAMVEAGAASRSIPFSLNELLAARLDRLTGAGKDVAQLGAVLGREFSYALIHRVAHIDEASLRLGLMQLLESDLLRHEAQIGEPHYVFKHALVQEAAYRSLTPSQQRDHHRRAAEVLARDFPHVAEAQPELLAHHHIEAGEHAQAIAFLEKAGQLAARRAAVSDAETHYRHALKLLLRQPESSQRDRDELRLQLALGAPLMATRGYANPDVRDTYGRARELCERAGDDSLLFDSVLGLWYFYMVGGEVATSVGLARQLLAQAQKTADPVPLMLAHRALATSLILSGEFEGCRTHTEIGANLYDRAQHGKLILKYGQDPGVTNTAYLAWSLWYLGFPDQALRRAEDALALARALQHPLNIALAVNYVAHVRNYRGEYAIARGLAEEAMSIAVEHQLALWHSFSKIELGWALIGLGDRARGGELLKDGVASWTRTGAKGGRTFFLAPLVWGQLQSRALDDAMRTIEEIDVLISQTGELLIQAELLRLRGEVMLLRSENREDEVEALFVRGLEIARTQKARAWELRLATSLGRLLARRGRALEGRQLVESSLATFTEGLDTADVREARELLQSL